MQDTITKPLLKWYGENKRVLPWREKKNPYEIWVSEIMLQQTRVEAVKPFYERFMRELPNVAALAVCPEEKLLKLWEGLGYYNRVRNMQKAAQKIMEVYDGVFPADYEALKGLPGIGNYTAGAVASIAFCIPVPAVDGNVLRVMARLREDGEDILKQSVDKKEYDILMLKNSQIGCTNGAVHYALLPVWVVKVEYKDKMYRFAMNGQTGKLVGELPIDSGLFWKNALGFFAGSSIVVYLLIMLVRLFL